jgi:hypothetical protein
MQLTFIKFGFIGAILASAAVVFIVLGAVYFGVASCGGYAWHKELFCFATPTVAISSVCVPNTLLRSFSRKFAFLLVLLVTYFVIEAATATIYFGASSVSEFGRHFLQSLEFGPC